jgi:hypothetical protein
MGNDALMVDQGLLFWFDQRKKVVYIIILYFSQLGIKSTKSLTLIFAPS